MADSSDYQVEINADPGERKGKGAGTAYCHLRVFLQIIRPLLLEMPP